MPWTPVEQAWRDALLDATVPGQRHRPSQLPAEAWATWEAGAAPLLRVGFRATVWALTWAPVLRWLRPFHRLDDARREAFLTALAVQQSWVIRQLVMVLRLVAATALARLESR